MALLACRRLFAQSCQKFVQNLPIVNKVAHARCICGSVRMLAGRRFTEKHEWITIQENSGTVGISHFAQDQLGDLVYVEFPDVGSEFKKGDEAVVLESVKAAVEVYCPVAGKISEVNGEVSENPGLINKAPYNEGWLFKLTMPNKDQFGELMEEKDYNTFVESQA